MSVWVCGEREGVATYQRKEMKNDAGNIKKLVDNEEWGGRERTLIYEEIFKKLDTDKGGDTYACACSHIKMGIHV